ncbi:MAG TPA: ATP-binding protein [Candidatus Acidoferrales bacterium]|nr:ATP-binding protein [Candidatus Acidoferrales bacterium]
MKISPKKNSARPVPVRVNAGETFGELAEIRARLAAADETLRAIRSGEVDAVMGAGKQGDRVFTLEGAGHAYRLLIESMNEGALTLTADKTILFANQCFATMVKCPLEEVTGGSFRRFLSVADRALLRPLMKRAAKTGSQIQVLLHAGDGSLVPALLSIRELANQGSEQVIIGMVVTNMTEARRTEELLRALTNRVVEVQEAERGHVALELHDTITQMLCAVLVRSQTLADTLPASEKTAKKEAVKLCELLGETAEEVERISRNLRPSVLDHLGLVAGLHDASTEFSHRTGVSVKLTCVELTVRLNADTELALYRILQETLKNVGLHARASHVTVHLTKPAGFVQLSIHDDGVGFNPEHRLARRKDKEKNGFGLLGMRERAAYVGGALKVKSNGRTGTEIEIRIPVPATVAGN